MQKSCKITVKVLMLKVNHHSKLKIIPFSCQDQSHLQLIHLHAALIILLQASPYSIGRAFEEY